MPVLQGSWDASGKRFAVIVSRWNEMITKELLAGAVETLQRQGAEEPLVIHVPGTWEIPPVAAHLAQSGQIHGIVALGCILQGATTHAQLLAADVSRELMAIQSGTGVPVSWGILTPETSEQAVDRAGMKMGNKGREAALAAIELANVLDALRPDPEPERAPANGDDGVV